jgi:hypothetical protein
METFMPNHSNYNSAESGFAETPLVIVYIVALAIFAYGWSNFNPPTTSILELRATTAPIAVRPGSDDYTP